MKKIFIFCPANVATGGPEALHQLCYQLRNLGYDALMMYTNYQHSQYDTPVCSQYLHYQNPFVLDYEDSFNNICIIPETGTGSFYLIKEGTKILWWLSVDNYVKAATTIRGYASGNHYITNIIYIIKKNMQKIYDIKRKDIKFHFVQSYYALNYCKKIGIPEEKIFYISDYLSDDYLQTSKENITEQKNNQVLFNPKKGIEFTKQLMQQAPDIQWIPIVNLSYEQARELMAQSKVYIDFGNHPGKDRLPREAAVNGCCIITGKRGSAQYKKDIPIPNEFKFEDKEDNIESIIKKIHYIMENYNQESNKFAEYREKIYSEEDHFRQDIKNAFSKIYFQKQ